MSRPEAITLAEFESIAAKGTDVGRIPGNNAPTLQTVEFDGHAYSRMDVERAFQLPSWKRSFQAIGLSISKTCIAWNR